jgi:hypothetical protein
MAGDIAARATTVGGTNAYGIFTVGAMSIGSIAETGSITATAGLGYTVGLYSVTDVTITGQMAGDIAATATSGSGAYGIYSQNGANTICSIASTGSITAKAGRTTPLACAEQPA